MSGTDAFVVERRNEIERLRHRGQKLGFDCDLGFFRLGFEGVGMTLNGGDVISDAEDEGARRECGLVVDTPSFLVCPLQQQQYRLVVGYALTSKKKKSFLQPNLEVLARKKGILFVAIDQNRLLSAQGPFDVILHKLSGKQWQEAIEDYQQKYPEAIILDPPGAIQHVHNRQSMLQAVADLNLSDCKDKVCVPRQIVVMQDRLSMSEEVAKAGLKFPLVAKPLLVDGTAKSHQLFLAYDRFSLLQLEPPLVLQQFVNHGGILFKIFVVGETIKVVRRFSLDNISNCEIAEVDRMIPFPRVSSAAASAEDANLDSSVAELPPKPFLERLVKELRSRLGLRLFNIDMIREYGSKDVFYIIDINYFPGYGKVPDYEHIFIDFFLTLAQNKHKKGVIPLQNQRNHIQSPFL